MSAHTPGPWHPFMGIGSTRAAIHAAAGHVAFCTMRNPTARSKGLARPEMEANARLIAAAPELLEALEKIITRATNHPDDDDADRKRNLYHVQSIALDAIKKATGAA